MKNINKLTKKQEQRLIEYKETYLEFIFGCKTKINKEQYEKGIEWLYGIAGRKKPIIVYADSPMAAQLTAIHLKEYLHNPEESWRLEIQIETAILGKLEEEKEAFGDESIKIDEPIIDLIIKELRNPIETDVSLKFYQKIKESVSLYLKMFELEDSLPFALISPRNLSNTVSYKFKHEIGGNKSETKENILNLILSGFLDTILFKECCIVSSLPTKINRNDNGDLHSTKDYAVEWADGYGIHFINGNPMPGSIFESFTKTDIDRAYNKDVVDGIMAIMKENEDSNIKPFDTIHQEYHPKLMRLNSSVKGIVDEIVKSKFK